MKKCIVSQVVRFLSRQALMVGMRRSRINEVAKTTQPLPPLFRPSEYIPPVRESGGVRLSLIGTLGRGGKEGMYRIPMDRRRTVASEMTEQRERQKEFVGPKGIQQPPLFLDFPFGL